MSALAWAVGVVAVVGGFVVTVAVTLNWQHARAGLAELGRYLRGRK